MKNKVNIGTASVILIFIILCLSVFSLLSLSDAKSAEVFADRRADSVTAYYQADSAGQKFIQAASEALEGGLNAAEAVERASSVLPDGATAQVDSGELEELEDGGEREARLICEIPMSAGQSLHVELSGRDASVLAYYVYNSEDYAIDNRLPVWTGSGN